MRPDALCVCSIKRAIDDCLGTASCTHVDLERFINYVNGSRNFQILKNDPETSAIFIDNPLISFRRNKNIRDNLVRSALRQNLPAPSGTFSCSRARCYTCSFSATSISDLNPISLFGTFYMHLLQHHLLHFLQ